MIVLLASSTLALNAETEEEKRAEALDKLEQQIRFATSAERKLGIAKIKNLEDEEQPRFIPLLQDLARDDRDATVQVACLNALSELKHTESEPVFVELLESSNRDVVRAAIFGLGNLELASSAAPVSTAIKDEDFTENNQILISMIRLLSKLENREMVPYLRGKYDEEDTHLEVRRNIILYFGRAGAQDQSAFLLEEALDEELEMTSRAYAINSLGHLEYAAAKDPLRTELDRINALDPQEKAQHNIIRMHLLTTLARLGDESVNVEIMNGARDDDERMRARSLRQIDEARIDEARPLLEYMTENDPSQRIRRQAQSILDGWDGNESSSEDDDGEQTP